MVTIIIVTYNSENFIKKCIEGVYSKTEDVEYEIIVVDNNSTDRTAEIVYRNFKNVRLIRNRKNMGFGAANNIAIERSSGEYIMLLNPDTVLENNAIKVLVDQLKADSNVGCAGAKLLYFDGSLQLSCRQFPNYINVFFGRRSIIRHLFPKNPVSREFMLENMDYNYVQEVDWIMGAAMMMRRSTIEEVGSFDERYFLFVEDTDLCYRMVSSGKKVVYVPSAVIRHFHGASVRRGFSKSQLHHNIGMYKFFKKYSIPKNKALEFVLYCAILVRLTIVFATEQFFTVLKLVRRKPMEEYR
ncbi:MAG: glycosyltransferase family 2 protein [bacterium]